jgi:hypothetical protein
MKKETYILLNTKMNKAEIKNKISDLFIVREDDGSYNLFGRFLIEYCNGEYVLQEKGESIKYTFYFLKHAVTWCVLNNTRNKKLIKRVQEVDNELVSLDAAIENHTRLLYKNSENAMIYRAKLQEEKLKKRKLLDEINEYTALSKHIQRTKFKENQAL